MRILYYILFLFLLLFSQIAFGQPSISVHPDTLVFNDVPYGSIFLPGSKTLNLAIINSGNDTLEVSNISSSTAVFTVDTLNFQLLPYQQFAMKVKVTFAPNAIGNFTGYLDIFTNDPINSTVRIYLFGNGIVPPASLSGLKTIGVGGDFTTLKEAFDSINVRYLSDTLRLVLMDGTYNEPQLKLQPGANQFNPPPIIIGPLEGSLSKPIINIDKINPDIEYGMNLSDAPNVLVQHVTFVLDPSDMWQTVVSIKGSCPDAQFNDVVIDGGNANLGFEVYGNTTSLAFNTDTIHNVINGIFAFDWTALTVENSVIDHATGMGIYFETFGSNIQINNNELRGNNSADVGVCGAGDASGLSITNNNVSGYLGAGIMMENFAGNDQTSLSAKHSVSTIFINRSISTIRSRVEERITTLVNRDIQALVEQAKQKYSTALNNPETKSTRSLADSNPINIYINNNIITNDAGAEYGIYIDNIAGSVSGIEIMGNTIRYVWSGIEIGTDRQNGTGSFKASSNNIETYGGVGLNFWDVNKLAVVEINNNIVTALEAVNVRMKARLRKTSHTSAAPIGDCGIMIYANNMLAEGSTFNVDSNTVSGFFYGIMSSFIVNGTASISKNTLTDGGVVFEDATAGSLTVDDNKITGFDGAGITCYAFNLYNAAIPGGVSISRNTVSGGASAWLAIYCGGISAYTLAVDDNTISGNYNGGGITIEYFYTPEPGVQRTVQKKDANINVKDHLSDLWTKVKEKANENDSTTSITDATQRRKERIINGKKTINSQSYKLVQQSWLSVQRNHVLNQGGGTGAIIIFGAEGPLTINITDNTLAVVGGNDYGIYLGETFGSLGIQINGNTVRNVFSRAIWVDYSELDYTGYFRANSNDIETDAGGLYLYPLSPQMVNVEDNKIQAVETSLSSYTGLKLYIESWVPGSSLFIKNNRIQNFTRGINLYTYGISSFDLYDNIIQRNDRGIYWESMVEDFTHGTIARNFIANNRIGGEFILYYYPISIDILHNSFVNNSSVGMMLSPFDGVAPIVRQNNLFSNSGYAIINESDLDINAHNNWWGDSATTEMVAGPYPQNITSILDKMDESYRGIVDYSGWLTQEASIDGDISLRKIIQPGNVVTRDSVCIPMILVRNNGLITDTANIMYELDDVYSETGSIILGPGETDTLFLSPWIPTKSGSFDLKCYSTSDHDPCPFNDTLKTTITIVCSECTMAIYSVDPGKGFDNGILPVTIKGKNFFSGASVRLKRDGCQSIIGENTIVIDDYTITSDLNLTGRQSGEWDLVVANPDGQNDIFRFTLVHAVERLLADIVGRSSIRVGRPANFLIQYSNNGNIDLYNQILIVRSPDDASVCIPTVLSEHNTLPLQPVVTNTEAAYGIYIPKIAAGSSVSFPLSFQTSSGSSSTYVMAGFLSKLSTFYMNNSESPRRKGYDNPPKGSTVFAGPAGKNPFGHEAIVDIVDGKTVVWDPYLANKRPDIISPDGSIPFSKEGSNNDWLDFEGENYLGWGTPPGWNEDIGNNAAQIARDMFKDGIPPWNLEGGKNKKGKGWSCSGFGEDVYEQAGIDPIPKDLEPFLSPGFHYGDYTGNRDFYSWPESIEGDGKYIFPLEVALDYWGNLFNEIKDNISKGLGIMNSCDPNEKVGPMGSGIENFISNNKSLDYIVYFENIDTATASAQEIEIIDTLDNNLAWNTLAFGDLQIGDSVIVHSGDSTSFVKTYQLNDTVDIDINGTFNQENGIIRWHMKGRDRRTGELADFLPPNDTSIAPRGEGWVSFSIKPDSGLESGTQITNRASIIFDVNPPMLTNEVFNTIDSKPPISSIVSVTILPDSNYMRISWTGNDDTSGSGVRSYSLYRGENNGPSQLVYNGVSDTSAIVTVGAGIGYNFMTLAVDSVGNVEHREVYDQSVIMLNDKSAGWNLVSLPVASTNAGIKHLFPNAISSAFAYSSVSGYSIFDTLSCGIGYWLKFPVSQNIAFRGLPVISDTIPVVAGWNLIGSITNKINVSTISSDPSGIVTSSFFLYNNNYQSTDSICPGKGYWVKVDKAGSLIMSVSNTMYSTTRIKIVTTPEMPPSPPDYVTSSEDIPVKYSLEDAYPNPFNPITTLKYSLPSNSKVRITIYNVLGQVVSVLMDDLEVAGYKSIEWNASNVSSGVYFYRIEASSTLNPSKTFIMVKKMILMK